jgi:hypothetical protein
MTVTLDYFEGEWSLSYEVPGELSEHGGIYTSYGAPPKPLDTMPRILERALDGEIVPLSKGVRRKVNTHEDLASKIFQSVIFEMAVPQLLRTSYLSATELPVRILSAISGDRDLARRNSLVQKYLTSMVPFIGGISLDAVVRLRQREQEAFLTYRQALNKAIDNVEANAKAALEWCFPEITEDNWWKLRELLRQKGRLVVTPTYMNTAGDT